MNGCWGSYFLAQGKLILSCSSADRHDGVAGEVIGRHFQIPGRRALADARGGVVVRPVARAEIAAVIAARFALGGANRHAAAMGAYAERYQPASLAGLAATVDRLRVASTEERSVVNEVGGT